VLDPKPFDIERDLVTATMKKRRNSMLKYYQVGKGIYLNSLDLLRSLLFVIVGISCCILVALIPIPRLQPEIDQMYEGLEEQKKAAKAR
jgi:hypothetical protein